MATNNAINSSTPVVIGPTSATDNALARFDTTTGSLIQNGIITEDDTGNLTVSTAVSGGQLAINLNNTSNTASASSLVNVSVGGATADDAYIRYTVTGATSWASGVDNSDSDAYVISASTTLGTTNTVRIGTAGEMRQALQPCFFALKSAVSNDVTGDGTQYGPIVFDSEIFDQGNNYNNSTGVFTAPITGRYNFSYSVQLLQLAAAHTTGVAFARATNRDMYIFNANPGAMRSNGNALNIIGSFYVDMNAADTISCFVTISNSTKVVDVNGDATTGATFFSGCLVC